MTTQAVPPSPYELKEQPDGSAYTARENLEAILERELVGPLYGDDEVISVAPDTAYPLGRIAPSSLTPDDKGETDGPEDNEDLGPDEDGGEDAAPKRGLMIPASMGLRFQIPNDLAAFTVHASWGKYHSRNVEGEKAEDGRVRREFVRTPMDAGVHVQVAELSEGTTRDYPLADNAVLRVDIYKDGDRHLVEIALCNDAEVVGRIPVKDWLFQAKLTVEAGDQAVFLPVRDALIDTQLDEFDSEANRLTLQYRDRLEFAIGRTCSATWYVEDKARRANKVWTTWVPSFETPQTQAGANDDVITDMAQLATATDDELRAGLDQSTPATQPGSTTRRPRPTNCQITCAASASKP